MRNLLVLVVVVVEILNYLLPSREADQYHLRIRSQFIIPNMKAAIHGFESLTYLGPRYGRLYHNFKRNRFFKKL